MFCGYKTPFLLCCCKETGPELLFSTEGSKSPFQGWISWLLFNVVPSKGKCSQVLQPAREVICDLGDMGIIPCQKWQVQRGLMGNPCSEPSKFLPQKLPQIQTQLFLWMISVVIFGLRPPASPLWAGVGDCCVEL